jgi:hypothetical protein
MVDDERVETVGGPMGAELYWSVIRTMMEIRVPTVMGLIKLSVGSRRGARLIRNTSNDTLGTFVWRGGKRF